MGFISLFGSICWLQLHYPVQPNLDQDYAVGRTQRSGAGLMLASSLGSCVMHSTYNAQKWDQCENRKREKDAYDSYFKKIQLDHVIYSKGSCPPLFTVSACVCSWKPLKMPVPETEEQLWYREKSLKTGRNQSAVLWAWQAPRATLLCLHSTSAPSPLPQKQIALSF